MHAANRAGGVEELAGWFDFCKTAPAAPALVMTSRFLLGGASGGLKTSVETTAEYFGEEEEAEGSGIETETSLNHLLPIYELRLTSLLLRLLKMDKGKRITLKQGAPRQGPAPLRVKQGRLQGEIMVARLQMISTRATSNLDNVLSSVDSMEETMKRNHEHVLKRSREVRQDAINSTSTILKDIKESIDFIKNLPEGEIGNGILGIAMHEVMTLNGRNDNIEQSEPTELDDTITLNSTVDISSSADNTTAVMIGEGDYLRDMETGVVDTEMRMARRATSEMDEANSAESVSLSPSAALIADRSSPLSSGAPPESVDRTRHERSALDDAVNDGGQSGRHHFCAARASHSLRGRRGFITFR